MSGTKVLMSLVVFLGLPCAAMVIKTDQGFFVNDHGVINAVKPYDVDPFLRKLSPVQLQRFGQLGNRIKAIQLHNGDYILRAKGDLNGGGPILGCITAVVGYTVVGIATLATTIAVAVTDPANALVAGAAIATAGAAAVTTAAIVATEAPTP